jgi:hypothetical protein
MPSLTSSPKKRAQIPGMGREAKYRDYLDMVVELRSEAKKAQLEGTAFTLDAVFQVPQILYLDLAPLMTVAIACYSFITQNDTLTGLKLEGVRDALENMRVFITAHAVRPEKWGRPHPPGSYTIQFPKGSPFVQSALYKTRS